MRFLSSTLILLALIGFNSCGSEDLVVEADFESTLVEGYTYSFSVTTAEYSQVEWIIEGNTYTKGTIEHTFSGDGTYEIQCKVILENDKGDLAEDIDIRTLTLATQFETVKVTTKFGSFSFYLYQTTPLHKANMIKLAEENYYDGTTFHRIIDGFVIQGGDPNSKDNDDSNDGLGGPGYTVERELNDKLEHVQGAIGAARKSSETASNGSQFYVVENEAGAHHLDGGYTVFGIVFDGLDVVAEIAEQGKDGSDRPLNKITMDVDLVYLSAKSLKDTYGFEIPAE